MNKLLIGLGLFFILSAKPIELLTGFILSKMGVPDISDITEEIADSMPLNDEAKEISGKAVKAVRITENIPLYLFLIGVVLLLIGIFISG